MGRAASGHTQRELLELREREHEVCWSAQVLRRVTNAVSQGVAEHLHQAQKEQLLAWLRAADGSTGRRKDHAGRSCSTRLAAAYAALVEREPNAVLGILHSAAKHHSELSLDDKQEEAYRKAHQYLNNHKASMDYQTYRRLGLPIGSGITEAACKTVFTQRFKESGMSWGIKGGSVQPNRVVPLKSLGSIVKAMR